MSSAGTGFWALPDTFWSGSISFGLVNVPVRAYSAVRDHTVHFHQLDKRSGNRIQYQKVSGKAQKPVPADDIVKGYELSDDHVVVVEDDELDDLQPRTTRTIDITDFVDLADIDPIYYKATYWLGPAGEPAERAYRLLQVAMEDTQRAAIGTVVMRNKQYLAAVRPLDGVLAMSTMRFADEVLPRGELDIPSGGARPAAKELRLGTQIIDSLRSDWDPGHYHDTYTEQLRELIEQKANGEEPTIEAPAEDEGGELVDLMAALQASVDAAKSSRSGRSGRSGGTSRTAKTSRASKPSKPSGSSKAASSPKSSASTAGAS